MTGVKVLTVSRLNDAVEALLEDAFPLVWVEGEISNLAKPRSGHLYFTLKDDAAQVRCAMFRNRNILLRFRPSDGGQVLLRARVTLYTQRGEFQLVVEHMEESGEGALRRRFEAIRDKLESEGLFTAERKRELPRFPRRIGVITSPTGAALRDILQVLGRRFPSIPVLVLPTPVQGEEAASQIARQLRDAGQRGECDVLIIGRGGGSLEDLWAFNEEIVARAIADCPIPVVSAVGHETDVTITDLVADVRAPTPSAAAEIASPDGAELGRRLGRVQADLARSQQRRLGHLAQRLDWLERRVGAQHPRRRLHDVRQRAEQLQARLHRAMRAQQVAWRTQSHALESRLWSCTPRPRLDRACDDVHALEIRLSRAARGRIASLQSRVAAALRNLGLASPIGTMERGYALLQRSDDGTVVRDPEQVAVGDELQARLARGRIVVSVLSKGT